MFSPQIRAGAWTTTFEVNPFLLVQLLLAPRTIASKVLQSMRLWFLDAECYTVIQVWPKIPVISQS